MGRRQLRLDLDEIELVTLAHEHVDELAALRVANEDDIRSSSGGRHPLEFTVEDVTRSLARRIDVIADDRHPFVIVRSGAIVGDLNLSQIAHGSEESANLGLLVDRTVRGQGIASTAIALACRLAFEDLGLHRLQAGIQPSNLASQRAFVRNGFEQIGLAKGYLCVNGAWRDHLLFQRLAPSS
jgi:[ribosomal protein S5]-alanine N-acetyltransferase